MCSSRNKNTEIKYGFLLIFTIQFALAVYIPEHYDLRKEGETKFNGEIYKILAPSKHIVIDHQDTIDKAPAPSKRMFIDEIGFNHYWSYLGKRINKLENLRKTGGDIEVLSKNNADAYIHPKTAASITETNQILENFRKTGEDIEVLSKNNAEANSNSSSAINTNSINQVKEHTETIAVKTKTTKTIKITRYPQPKRKNKNITSEPYVPRPRIIGRAGKTLVHSTYFCPFFGVITMHSYLD